MTVGARLYAYVCKASHGHDGDERKMILYYCGDILDGGKVIGLVPAFSLVWKCSPAVDICCLLLGHVSVSGFARLWLGLCTCVLGDWGGSLVVLMG